MGVGWSVKASVPAMEGGGTNQSRPRIHWRVQDLQLGSDLVEELRKLQKLGTPFGSPGEWQGTKYLGCHLPWCISKKLDLRQTTQAQTCRLDIGGRHLMWPLNLQCQPLLLFE